MLPGFSDVNIPDVVLETLVTGGETIAGFMAAEGLANTVGRLYDQAATSNGRLIVKSIGAIGTGIAAFVWDDYQNHLLVLAGGMAGNAIATAIKNQLPAELQALIPSVAGISQLRPLNPAARGRIINQPAGSLRAM